MKKKKVIKPKSTVRRSGARKKSKHSADLLGQKYTAFHSVYRKSLNSENAVEVLQVETGTILLISGYAAQISVGLIEGKSALEVLKSLGLDSEPRAIKKTISLVKDLLKQQVICEN